MIRTPNRTDPGVRRGTPSPSRPHAPHAAEGARWGADTDGTPEAEDREAADARGARSADPQGSDRPAPPPAETPPHPRVPAISWHRAPSALQPSDSSGHACVIASWKVSES